MDKKVRWNSAIESEVKFWKSITDINASEEGIPKRYHNYKNYFAKYFSDVDFRDKLVLELGCGPRGAGHYLSEYSKYIGVDPLIQDYMSFEKFERGEFIQAKGENLPINDGSIDIVFSRNVLDHVQNYNFVLDEICRVLKPDGLFLLDVHVLNPKLKKMGKILDIIDRPHPHHFTALELDSIVKEKKFIVQKREIEQFKVYKSYFSFRGLKARLGKMILMNYVVKLSKIGNVDELTQPFYYFCLNCNSQLKINTNMDSTECQSCSKTYHHPQKNITVFWSK